MSNHKFNPLFPSVAPEAKPLHLQWHWEKLPPGGAIKGWVAGPSVFVWTHYSPHGTKTGDPATKPCYERLINGLIPCPHCKLPKPSKIRKTGYVPLIDERRRRLVVTVSESVGPRVANLGPYAGVQLSRSQGKRDPVHVQYLNEHQIRPCPIRFDSIHGEDITRWLLELWDDADLKEFFEKADRASQLASTRESTIQHNNDYRTAVNGPFTDDGAPVTGFRGKPEVNYFTGMPNPAPHQIEGSKEHAAEQKALTKAIEGNGVGVLKYALGLPIAPENQPQENARSAAWKRAIARGEPVKIQELATMSDAEFDKYLKLEASGSSSEKRDSVKPTKPAAKDPATNRRKSKKGKRRK